jgi:uncharacterized membrane protein YfcA
MLLLLLLLIVGSFGGFLAGIMGVGGGLVFIPVLTFLFAQFPELTPEESVRFTLANSIALVFASGVSGIHRQIKLGLYQWKGSLLIGIPGALAASLISYFIQQGNSYNKERFTWVFLGFLLLSMLNMIFKKDAAQETKNSVYPKFPTLKSIAVGFFAGMVVALSGLGGGIVMVPLFRMVLKLPIKQATALSLSIVPLLSILPIIQYTLFAKAPLLQNPHLSLLHHQQLGQFQYFVAWFYLPMALGVIFFSSFGQKVATRTPASWIRFIFALLSGLILIKTLYEIY